MQGPDYGNISRVDPDGGQAYTTLQGWWNDTKSESVIQHAECYHGNSAGLGSLTMGVPPPPTWYSDPNYDADHPCCIYAADGSEQDGSQDDELQGAAVVVSTAGPSGVAIKAVARFMCFSGLRFSIKASALHGILSSFSGAAGLHTIERCIFTLNSTVGEGDAIAPQALTSGHVLIARNNLIINKDSTRDTDGIFILTYDPSSSISIEAYNNSIANCAGALGAGIYAANISTGQVDITARNNVVAHDGNQGGSCFDDLPGDGTVNWTGSSHNVTSDATAVGSNSLTNKSINLIWEDITDDGTPLAPKRGGTPAPVLDPANGVNLYADGIETDGLGVERPSQGAQFRGAVEISDGLYKVYSGQTPALVDYDSPLESVRAGTASAEIQGLGLAAGGTRWLTVRATSAAGVEETNTDRLARAATDASGDLQSPPLAAVRELTAEKLSDGSVVIGFSHATMPGWAVPLQFEVFSDEGTGEFNLSSPLSVIDVADRDAGDYEAILDEPTLPAAFSVRARSGSQVGPLAPPVTISSAEAPIPPQQL